MIRRTLAATQAATFSIQLPDVHLHAMPRPTGTGFFVSPDGWFVTAAHVVADDRGNPRSDVENAWLVKEGRGGFRVQYQWPMLDHLLKELDLALLKLDFRKNAEKESLRDKTGFPFVQVSTRTLQEAEPVYAFGYPLSSVGFHDGGMFKVGFTSLRPRVTSAIVASLVEGEGALVVPGQPGYYVLDKALNYGNSGGPIVAVESGYVHALCSRFQPLKVQQAHWPFRDPKGNPFAVVMPSLYGVVANLSHPLALQEFRKRGIPLAEEGVTNEEAPQTSG